MSKFYSVTVILLVLLTACTNKDVKLSSFRADADRYCKVHTVEYWKSIGKFDELNKMDSYEKANAFSRAFRESVKTPEMKIVIFDEGKQVNIREYYSFLQKRIPELTQERFVCPAVAEFYSSNGP